MSARCGYCEVHDLRPACGSECFARERGEARTGTGAKEIERLRAFARGAHWRAVYDLALSPDPEEWFRLDIQAVLRALDHASADRASA